MGLLSFFTESLKQSAPRRVDERTRSGTVNIPPIGELLYPGELPSFEEIARGGHGDVRALAYAMRCIHTPERPITTERF